MYSGARLLSDLKPKSRILILTCSQYIDFETGVTCSPLLVLVSTLLHHDDLQFIQSFLVQRALH